MYRPDCQFHNVHWPVRKPVFGIPVSPTTYSEATECIMNAARGGISACIDFMPVHGLMLAAEDLSFGKIIREKFDMVCPDGQPLRWALNKYHNSQLQDRVYGPKVTLLVLKKCEESGTPVFFYGSYPGVLSRLQINLKQRYPELIIKGMESPPFRVLSADENKISAEKINKSGARVLFVGLGCPKQEMWVGQQKGTIHMPMLCVGAAFDFHAGVKKQAPEWMQKRSLEWAFRLATEPGRLWKRYMYYNCKFILKALMYSVSNL